MKTLETICADFEQWPYKWMGVKEDLIYGKNLLEIFRPFAEQITSSDLSERAIKKSLDNLWLLGGEIIWEVSINEEYDVPPIEILMESVGSLGGIYCRHVHSDADKKAYDKTCIQLAKYLGSKERCK